MSDEKMVDEVIRIISYLNDGKQIPEHFILETLRGFKMYEDINAFQKMLSRRVVINMNLSGLIEYVKSDIDTDQMTIDVIASMDRVMDDLGYRKEISVVASLPDAKGTMADKGISWGTLDILLSSMKGQQISNEVVNSLSDDERLLLATVSLDRSNVIFHGVGKVIVENMGRLSSIYGIDILLENMRHMIFENYQRGDENGILGDFSEFNLLCYRDKPIGGYLSAQMSPGKANLLLDLLDERKDVDERMHLLHDGPFHQSFLKVASFIVNSIKLDGDLAEAVSSKALSVMKDKLWSMPPEDANKEILNLM